MGDGRFSACTFKIHGTFEVLEHLCSQRMRRLHSFLLLQWIVVDRLNQLGRSIRKSAIFDVTSDFHHTTLGVLRTANE